MGLTVEEVKGRGGITKNSSIITNQLTIEFYLYDRHRVQELLPRPPPPTAILMKVSVINFDSV